MQSERRDKSCTWAVGISGRFWDYGRDVGLLRELDDPSKRLPDDDQISAPTQLPPPPSTPSPCTKPEKLYCR